MSKCHIIAGNINGAEFQYPGTADTTCTCTNHAVKRVMCPSLGYSLRVTAVQAYS